MLHPDAKLVVSKIEGKGLVARRLIPKGTIIWKHDPSDRLRTYSWEQYKRFSEKHRRAIDRYSYPEDDGTIVYSLDDDRFWNHSCDANTLNVPGKDMCVVVRDIRPGEEITYDYGLNLRPDLTIHCNCASGKCRKTVRRIDRTSKAYEDLQTRGAEAAALIERVPQPLLHE